MSDLFFVHFANSGNSRESVEFETLSGVLSARRHGDYISLDLPANPSEPEVRVNSNKNEIEFC